MAIPDGREGGAEEKQTGRSAEVHGGAPERWTRTAGRLRSTGGCLPAVVSQESDGGLKTQLVGVGEPAADGPLMPGAAVLLAPA